MKTIFPLFILIIILTSCSNSQKISMQGFDQFGRAEAIDDSVLNSLQQKNDIVLAYATENYAWGRSATYYIITLNKNEWTGYNYFVRYKPALDKTTAISCNINPVVVSKESCDSILQFIEKNEVWKIKGDNGEDFCTNGTKNCTINDGATSRLWIITKAKLVNPSYYEPQFFEKCCPGNTERKLFIEAAKKINDIIMVSGGSR